MNENALEVLEQYDLEVHRSWKGRGVYFLDTSRGLHMLKEHRGSEEKMEKLWQLLTSLETVQFFKTDLPVRAKEGQFIVKDGDETSYILKRWREGKECDPRSELDVCRSMEGLGILHDQARELWQFESAEQRARYEGSNLVEEMDKRTRELMKELMFI